MELTNILSERLKNPVKGTLGSSISWGACPRTLLPDWNLGQLLFWKYTVGCFFFQIHAWILWPIPFQTCYIIAQILNNHWCNIQYWPGHVGFELLWYNTDLGFPLKKILCKFKTTRDVVTCSNTFSVLKSVYQCHIRFCIHVLYFLNNIKLGQVHQTFMSPVYIESVFIYYRHYTLAYHINLKIV